MAARAASIEQRPEPDVWIEEPVEIVEGRCLIAGGFLAGLDVGPASPIPKTHTLLSATVTLGLWESRPPL